MTVWPFGHHLEYPRAQLAFSDSGRVAFSDAAQRHSRHHPLHRPITPADSISDSGQLLTECCCWSAASRCAYTCQTIVYFRFWSRPMVMMYDVSLQVIRKTIRDSAAGQSEGAFRFQILDGRTAAYSQGRKKGHLRLKRERIRLPIEKHINRAAVLSP